MARPARLDPFSREFAAMIDEVLSPKARSAALAEVALVEIQRANTINRTALGSEPKYEQFVDGRQGAPLESVKAGGMILAEWSFLGQTLTYVREMLREASPFRSGRYRDSHLLIVDGVEIADGAAMPDEFDEAVFINSQPYSRKIERGLSAQAPSGVYQVVAAMGKRRFGNLARVSFTFRPLTGISHLDTWARKTSLMKAGRRTMTDADREEWLRRQPAITVKPY